MKTLLSILVLFSAILMFVCQASEIAFLSETARSTSHTRIKDGHVICTVPPEAAPGWHGVTFDIDLKPYRNTQIVLEITGQAEGISRPKLPSMGIKFMLRYYTPDGKAHWAENNGKYGTFASETLSFNTVIESDADLGELRLGIQNVSGKILYDLSSLRIKRGFAKQNTDHTCVYSEAVRNRPQRRGVMSPIVNQADEENFQVMRDWGVNLLRLQLNTSNNIAFDPELYQKFINHKIDVIIPAVLDLGEKYGISIIIDLHTPPGSVQTRNNPCLFDVPERVDYFIALWERIAKCFKSHPALYGYDLMNEPDHQRETLFDYWEVQKQAAEAIRQVDPETPIYIESNHLCSQYTFAYLSPIKLKNIIYQVHCYDPFLYTHTKHSKADQLAGKIPLSYPGIIGGARWERDSIRARLKAVRNFQIRHSAKIFVGEFSARACSPGAEQYLADSISVFEEFGWDWTYHAFREAKIWSLEHEGNTDDTLIPSTDNPRKRVLLEAFQKNNRSKLADLVKNSNFYSR